MASIIDELLVQTLRTEIQVSRLGLQRIAEQRDAASSGGERAHHAAAYDEQLKQVKSMELQLDKLLRQQQQEPRDGTIDKPTKAV